MIGGAITDAAFSSARLLRLYARISDADDAIPRLRRFVLDLAVRGKLVEQDAADEPAAELLKRITKEKARQRTDGERRKEVDLRDFSNNKVPFAPSSGWIWVRHGLLGETNIGLTYSPSDVSNVGIPVLRSSNIQGGKLDFGDLVRVKCEPKSSAMVLDQDLLICARNGSRALVGKAALIENLEEPAAFGAFMAIFRSSVNQYLYWFISSSLFRQVIDEVNTTTINQITQNNLRSTIVPLPLLAEQRRIVAKVDELMALCDRLQQARTGCLALRDRLTTASLTRLTAPETGTDTSPETFQSHARFALQSLPTLTTRPAQIKTLRQTILNLAVRGKLVKQDAADEPAAELLKAYLSKRLSAQNKGEAPFDVPNSWQWVEFADVAAFENGDRGKNYPNRNEYKDAGIPWINTGHIQPDGSLSAGSMHYISREKFNSLGGGKIRPGDILCCLRGATFGKTAFVEPYEEGAIASSLMIIRPSRMIDRRFTYYYLTSPYGRSQPLRFDNGTAQPNLSSGNVKKYLSHPGR